MRHDNFPKIGDNPKDVLEQPFTDTDTRLLALLYTRGEAVRQEKDEQRYDLLP